MKSLIALFVSIAAFSASGVNAQEAKTIEFPQPSVRELKVFGGLSPNKYPHRPHLPAVSSYYRTDK